MTIRDIINKYPEYLDAELFVSVRDRVSTRREIIPVDDPYWFDRGDWTTHSKDGKKWIRMEVSLNEYKLMVNNKR